MDKLRLPSYLSGVKDEYIKRSHRVGRVFLWRRGFNFMGDAMKHKHADLIHAWADGAEIEWRSKQYTSKKWYPNNSPNWDDDDEYRLKQKPDVVRNITVEATLKCGETCGEEFVQVFKSGKYLFPNLRLTFDGKTGELKSAEVL